MFTLYLSLSVQDHVPLIGQFEAMCPQPKHLKHFMALVLEPWKELGVSRGDSRRLSPRWVVLETLGGCSFILSFFTLPNFRVVVIVRSIPLGLLFLFQLTFNF